MAENENTQGGTADGRIKELPKIATRAGKWARNKLIGAALEAQPNGDVLSGLWKIWRSGQLGENYAIWRKLNPKGGLGIGLAAGAAAELLPWATRVNDGWLTWEEAFGYIFDEKGRKDFLANMHTRGGLEHRIDILETDRMEAVQNYRPDLVRAIDDKLAEAYAEFEYLKRYKIPPPRRHGWDETIANVLGATLAGASFGRIFSSPGMAAGGVLGAGHGFMKDYRESPIGQLAAQDRISWWEGIYYYLDRDAAVDFQERMRTTNEVRRKINPEVRGAVLPSVLFRVGANTSGQQGEVRRKLNPEARGAVLPSVLFKVGADTRAMETQVGSAMFSGASTGIRPAGVEPGALATLLDMISGWFATPEAFAMSLPASMSTTPAGVAQGAPATQLGAIINGKATPSALARPSLAAMGATPTGKMQGLLWSTLRESLPALFQSQQGSAAQGFPKDLSALVSTLLSQIGSGIFQFHLSSPINVAAGARTPDMDLAAVDRGMADTTLKLKNMIREIMREERRLAFNA